MHSRHLGAHLNQHRHVAWKAAITLAVAMAGIAQAALAQEIIWQQSVNYSNFSDWGPSQVGQSGSWNSELADDFDLNGTITRVDVSGYNSAQIQGFPWQGVWVRFRAVASDGTPGTIQYEQFIPRGSNIVTYDPLPSNFRITLPTSFHANGRHFLTVQLASDYGQWYWRNSNNGPARGSVMWYQDRAAGQTDWTHHFSYGDANSDLAFALWGTRQAQTPSLQTLSDTTLTRAGRLKLHGSDFGATQGTGTVRIGGAIAPVTKWTDTDITAYVPEGAGYGSDDVQVVNGGGASNALPLQVIARVSQGHVKWRFKADGLYFNGRPAVGSDGSVYAADVNGHLYALTANGGVRWIFNAPNPNVVGSVSLGSDGTVYFANNNMLFAVNQDGTLKWQIADPSFGSIFFGPNVGPDGNVYAVSDDGGQGYGAFAVSPQGQILWTHPGFLRFGNTGRNREIVFDNKQLYFNANNVDQTSGLNAFALGGQRRFVVPGSSQPTVAPNDVIWTQTGNQSGYDGLVAAYRSDGNRLFELNTVSCSTPLDSGPDNSVYMGSGISNWLALNPDGTVRWRLGSGNRVIQSPVAAPNNSAIVAGSYEIGGFAYVRAMRPANGALIWEVQLPAENGGWVRAMARPMFSPDSRTVYVGMDVNDGASDTYTYLYAFETRLGPIPSLIGAQRD